MSFNFIVFIKVLVFSFLIKFSSADVSDAEYALMPPVFHMDDYDRCMLYGDRAFYCTMKLQLAPTDPNDTSTVWNIIEESTKNTKYYRHDRLRYGLCVPYSCPNIPENLNETDEELRNQIENCYGEKFVNLGLKVSVVELICNTNQHYYEITIIDIVVGILFITYIVFVIFASIFEGVSRYKSKQYYEQLTSTTMGQILSAFSIPKNWYRLTTINENPNVRNLRFLQGMRFCTMICVILIHTCMTFFSGPISNIQYVEKMTSEPLKMILLNSYAGVQIFFIIGSLLLSYHFFYTFHGKKKVRLSYLIMAFVNRYIRLTPALAIMTIFEATWMIHMGNGPFWDKVVGNEYRFCKKNWWTNILYINNYYDNHRMCMQHTWYLAADTQMFLLALLLIVFMLKYKHLIKTTLIVIIVIGISIPGIVNYIYDYDILVRQYPEPLYNFLLEIDKWHKNVGAGYSNLVSYTLGIAIGYIYYVYKGKNFIRKNLIFVYLWYILIFGLPLSILFSAIVMYDEGYEYSRLGAAVYSSLNGNIYITGIALAIFGLMQGEGWFIKYVCEWKPIRVLARLTYSIYLVHLALQKMKVGLVRYPTYMSDGLVLYNVIGDATLSCIVGFVFCMIFEMPISALQKFIIPKTEKKYKNETEEIMKNLSIRENVDAQFKV